MHDTNTELLTVAGGFLLKGRFQDQTVIGRGETPEAAKSDFDRVYEIIERAWQRWLATEHGQGDR